jgi:hypothetical protein
VARDLGTHLLALLLYPGAALVLAVGLLAEAAAALVLGGASFRAALAAPLDRLSAALRDGPPGLAAALLALLAATQLAAPLNPVAPVERNVLVAAIAVAAAVWLVGVRPWTPAGARTALLAQACWLVSLLAPALLLQTLRPQAIGAVLLPALLPLKVVAALLALACLPALLRLGAPEGEPAGRLFLWLPLCGLFASLYFPPGSDDLAGTARFLGITLAVAAAAIGLAMAAARTPEAGRLYPRLLAPLAVLVLAIAAVTSALT